MPVVYFFDLSQVFGPKFAMWRRSSWLKISYLALILSISPSRSLYFLVVSDSHVSSTERGIQLVKRHHSGQLQQYWRDCDYKITRPFGHITVEFKGGPSILLQIFSLVLFYYYYFTHLELCAFQTGVCKRALKGIGNVLYNYIPE